MSLDSQISIKIKYISVFNMLLVLYIHSGFHNDELKGMNIALEIQLLIGNVVGRIAVPYFFIFSGFFFFLNGQKTIVENSIEIKKRIRTLLVPYIIACLYFVLFFLLMRYIPFTKKFINGDVLTLFPEFDVTNYIEYIFWKVKGMNSPLAFQLWFLRDLIVLIILSPIINIILKYSRVYAAIIFTLLAMADISFNWLPNGMFISLFWFGLGAILSFNKIGFPSRVSKRVTVFLLSCYFFFSFIKMNNFSMLDNQFLDILITLFGVISFWFLFDYVSDLLKYFVKIERYVLFTSSFTFFIYLFHEPTINVIRKLIVLLIGKSEIGYIVSYLTSPFIFSCIAILIAYLFRKYQPKLYSVIVGGRT